MLHAPKYVLEKRAVPQRQRGFSLFACDKDLDRAGERKEKRMLGTVHKVSGTEEADVRWGTQLDIILLPYPVPQSLPLPQSTATPEPTPHRRSRPLTICGRDL